MTLKRIFYDDHEDTVLEDVGLGDIQAFILENFESLTRLNKIKIKEKHLEETKKALQKRVLTRKQLDAIIRAVVDEQAFCTWYIAD